MGFSDELQQFKKFNRQRRIQYSEESFAKGIKFVTSPLELGFVRNLVNFDLGTDGKSLIPRQGLRTFEVSQELNPTEEYDSTKDYKEKQIYHASEVIEEDGETYKQMLIGNINSNNTGISPIKTGSLDLITVYPATQNRNVVDYNNENLKVLAQHTENYDDYEFFFNSPNDATIHGLILNDPTVIASHIGTEMATEGSKKYYCFRRNKSTGKTEPVFITFDKEKNCYVFEVLQIQKTTAYNASLSMYNMLQEDPYVFNDLYNAPSLQFMGVFVTDLEGNQRQATYRNTKYKFRMNYATAKNQKYKVVWSWKEPTTSSFQEIETQYYTFSETNPPLLQIEWASPTGSAILAIDAYPADTSEESGYSHISSQRMLVNVIFGETMSESAQNLDYTKYDLSTCRGMVTWGKRVGIYAPDKGLNMLFLSEPNNPAWFPYPRNVSLFNENIIKCIPYLDDLLVFTTDAIYQLTVTSNGDGWTEKCLQKNLNIQPCDVQFIKMIKNMVFFKSNNYFYMVVPNSTSNTGLTIAPISTNIEMLLDQFSDAVKEVLIEVYDYKAPVELIYYKNHVNYKNIYNVYTFKSNRNCYLNLYLIYNIETRYWTLYCIESQTLLDSYKIDVADVNIYMEYCPVVIDNKLSHSIQFLKYDDKRQDFYIQKYLTPQDDVEQICIDKQLFKNYQYIDTGYREHESDFKKRFRELQFKLNNYAQVDLTFYTQFMIDGYVRQDDSSYEVNQVVDPEDPRYGVITYDRVFDEEVGKHIVGATTLGETPLLEDEDGNKYVHNTNELIADKLMWKLDISEFPETVFWKSRFPVSGKGYVPRLKILNTDQERYEMLNISWVFRLLYSR